MPVRKPVLEISSSLPSIIAEVSRSIGWLTDTPPKGALWEKGTDTGWCLGSLIIWLITSEETLAVIKLTREIVPWLIHLIKLRDSP